MNKDLQKAWELIKELENDNMALTHAVRNWTNIGNEHCIKHTKIIQILEKKNKNLESDNRFLKKMVLKANSLNSAELGILLKDLSKCDG
jgi:hypothetical protein